MKRTKNVTLFLLYFFLFLLVVNTGCSGLGGSDSDDDDKGRASGEWAYHSETDMDAITITWESSDFVCNGPLLGEQTVRVTITDTTMIWSDDVITWPLLNEADETPTVTWIRENGTVGSPVGIWTTTGDDGSTYELEIEDDGTVSLSASSLLCGDTGDQ